MNSKPPTISICIPTYEMKGLGHVFLKHSLDILTEQTFKDFDIIISDHSTNDDIKNLCIKYSSMSINYFRNTENYGSSSVNINNAISHATGKLIKILFQDDFLYNKHSLEQIVAAFNMEKDNWIVTACMHTRDGVNFFRPFYPRYNSHIHLGNNTISSPSVMTIKNTHPLYFDEHLIWLMDCEYYKRCHDKFGDPVILNTITVVNRSWDHQVSNTLATKQLRNTEFFYVLHKYEHGIPFWYYRCINFLKQLFV